MPDEYRKLDSKLEKFVDKYGEDEALTKTGAFSNVFAQELFKKAVQDNYSIVYETTLKNLERFNSFVEQLKVQGYQLSLRAVVISVDENIKRAKYRFESKKGIPGTLPRKVEENVIREMGTSVPNNIIKAFDNVLIDDIQVLDNSSKQNPYNLIIDTNIRKPSIEEIKLRVSKVIDAPEHKHTKAFVKKR